MITYVTYRDREGEPQQIRTEQAPLLLVGLEIDVPDMPGQRVLTVATTLDRNGTFIQWVNVGTAVNVPGPLL